MAGVTLPVTAKWFWWNDKNWAPFDKTTNDRVDREYSALIHGTKKLTAADKRIKLDDQRFLDLAFRSEADIKTHFNNMASEKGLVGIQRRYEDGTKRRAVKRDVPDVLDGEVVVIVGFAAPAAELLASTLCSHGATTHPRVIQKVTLVVVDENSYAVEEKKGLAKAFDYDIPILSLKTLSDALTAGSKPASWDKFVYKPAPTAPPPAVAPPVPAPAAAAPAAAASTSLADVKRKSDDEDAGSGKKSKGSDFEWLTATSKWQGVCAYAQSGERYPFEMQMEPGAAARIVQGTITWTTLNGCVTRWRGKVAQDNAFTFEEYECVKGDDVETPVNYEAKAARAAITGKPILANLPAGESVTVTIDLISVATGGSSSVAAAAVAAPPAAAPKVVPGARFMGTCFSPLPFRMAVTDAQGADVKGTVEWPTLKAVTAFKGKLVPGKELTFTELTLVSGDAGDVTLPMQYTASALAGGGYEGYYGSGADKGTFKIASA